MAKDNQKRFIVALILSLFIFTVYFYIASRTSEIVYEKLGGYSNLYIYIVGVIIFFLNFLLIYYFCKKNYKICNYLVNKLQVLSALLALGWCFIAFCNEKNIYPNNALSYLRHNIPFIIYFIIIITGISIFIKLKNMNIAFGNWKMVFFCISLIILVFALMYSPNIYNDSYNTVFHIHAYTNSIMNILSLSPYDAVNCSIYGHYALLYYLPVKLISLFCSSELTAVIIAIAFIASITYAMILYCARKMISNDIVFCVTAMGLIQPVTQVMSQGQYYQLFPHRIFFPTLLLFVLLIEKERNIKYKNYLNWLLISLGFVWNIEIGMVCGIALLVYQIYKAVEDRNIQLRYLFYNCVCLILSFFISYILVNAYNLAIGGDKINIDQYIYPIGSEVYNIDALRLSIPSISAGYFMVMICFLSVLIYALYNVLNGTEKSKNLGILFIVSLVGLGKMTYFMNRTAYANLTIVHLEFMIILGCFIDNVSFETINKENIFKEIKALKAKNISYNWKTLFGYLAVLINTCICVAAVSYIGLALQNRIDTSWKMQGLNDMYEDIKRDIPEDVVAFGQGVPEIMGGMNRKTNLYITDWSGGDMNEYSLDAVEEKINNVDSFFALTANVNLIKSAETFTCIKNYSLPGKSYGGSDVVYQFGYYVRDAAGIK